MRTFIRYAVSILAVAFLFTLASALRTNSAFAQLFFSGTQTQTEEQGGIFQNRETTGGLGDINTFNTGGTSGLGDINFGSTGSGGLGGFDLGGTGGTTSGLGDIDLSGGLVPVVPIFQQPLQTGTQTITPPPTTQTTPIGIPVDIGGDVVITPTQTVDNSTQSGGTTAGGFNKELCIQQRLQDRDRKILDCRGSETCEAAAQQDCSDQMQSRCGVSKTDANAQCGVSGGGQTTQNISDVVSNVTTNQGVGIKTIYINPSDADLLVGTKNSIAIDGSIATQQSLYLPVNTQVSLTPTSKYSVALQVSGQQTSVSQLQSNNVQVGTISAQQLVNQILVQTGSSIQVGGGDELGEVLLEKPSAVSVIGQWFKTIISAIFGDDEESVTNDLTQTSVVTGGGAPSCVTTSANGLSTSCSDNGCSAQGGQCVISTAKIRAKGFDRLGQPIPATPEDASSFEATQVSCACDITGTPGIDQPPPETTNLACPIPEEKRPVEDDDTVKGETAPITLNVTYPSGGKQVTKTECVAGYDENGKCRNEAEVTTSEKTSLSDNVFNGGGASGMNLSAVLNGEGLENEGAKEALQAAINTAITSCVAKLKVPAPECDLNCGPIGNCDECGYGPTAKEGPKAEVTIHFSNAYVTEYKPEHSSVEGGGFTKGNPGFNAGDPPAQVKAVFPYTIDCETKHTYLLQCGGDEADEKVGTAPPYELPKDSGSTDSSGGGGGGGNTTTELLEVEEGFLKKVFAAPTSIGNAVHDFIGNLFGFECSEGVCTDGEGQGFTFNQNEQTTKSTVKECVQLSGTDENPRNDDPRLHPSQRGSVKLNPNLICGEGQCADGSACKGFKNNTTGAEGCGCLPSQQQAGGSLGADPELSSPEVDPDGSKRIIRVDSCSSAELNTCNNVGSCTVTEGGRDGTGRVISQGTCTLATDNSDGSKACVCFPAKAVTPEPTSEPETPSVPVTPSEPETPVTPSQPEEPSTTAPEVPEDSGKGLPPQELDEPADPEVSSPVAPTTPAEPKFTKEDLCKLPKFMRNWLKGLGFKFVCPDDEVASPAPETASPPAPETTSTPVDPFEPPAGVPVEPKTTELGEPTAEESKDKCEGGADVNGVSGPKEAEYKANTYNAAEKGVYKIAEGYCTELRNAAAGNAGTKCKDLAECKAQATAANQCIGNLKSATYECRIGVVNVAKEKEWVDCPDGNCKTEGMEVVEEVKGKGFYINSYTATTKVTSDGDAPCECEKGSGSAGGAGGGADGGIGGTVPTTPNRPTSPLPPPKPVSCPVVSYSNIVKETGTFSTPIWGSKIPGTKKKYGSAHVTSYKDACNNAKNNALRECNVKVQQELQSANQTMSATCSGQPGCTYSGQPVATVCSTVKQATNQGDAKNPYSPWCHTSGDTCNDAVNGYKCKYGGTYTVNVQAFVSTGSAVCRLTQ